MLARLVRQLRSEWTRSPADAGGQVRPTRTSRAAVSVLAGVGAMIYAYIAELTVPGMRDFDPLWSGSLALFSGRDPYAAVAHSGWPWPLYHPLPALIIDAPFIFLPRLAARIAFCGCATALFAWASTRRAWWPLLIVFSAPFRHSTFHAQLAPVLVSAALMPPLAGLLVVKPNIGLALFVRRPTASAIVGGTLLLAVSFAIWPGWMPAWLAEARRVTHVAPVLRPGGALLLLALLRRHQPDGRFLAVLALIPHRPVGYEMLALLALVPSRPWQLIVLMAGAEIARLYIVGVPTTLPIDTVDALAWPPLLALVYIPALIFVLMRPRTKDAAPTVANPNE